MLALLLLTTGTWRLVKTVTAFTVAHSITLGLATLGIVHVPSKPVEAVIALSIVFVAAEIVQARRGRAGLAARMPWIVAFTFGLLHGFGFAGALSEVGLPAGHIPVALLFFNLGVEAGQLLFVAAVLALVAGARRIRMRVAALGGTGAALCHRQHGDVLGDPARGCVLKARDRGPGRNKRPEVDEDRVTGGRQ